MEYISQRDIHDTVLAVKLLNPNLYANAQTGEVNKNLRDGTPCEVNKKGAT
jgi:hypothetical protein